MLKDNTALTPPLPPEDRPATTQPDQETGPTAKIKWIQDIMVGIIFVLFIGFASMFVAVGGLLIDAFQHKADSYEELSNQVRSQNAKIDSLTDEIHRAQPICTDHSSP